MHALKTFALAVLGLSVLGISPARATSGNTTSYVATNGSDSNTGTQASPFLTLTHAVLVTNNGGTINVGPGTYSGAGYYDLSVTSKALTIQSTGGAASTIIDLTGGTAQNAHYLVDFQNAPANGSVLQGFTVKNGFNDNGGAVEIIDCSATVRQCVFLNNSGPGSGGAIFVNCNNTTTGATISQCAFIGNTAGDSTDTGFGGAIEIQQIATGNGLESATITNCVFDANSANYEGGAIDVDSHNSTSPVVSIVNSTFTRNNAQGQDPSGYGETLPDATHQPGTVDVYYTDSNGNQVSNNTSTTLTNCILYGDASGAEISTLDPGASASYSDIEQSGYAGNNHNRDEAPAFVDAAESNPAQDDLHLGYFSPEHGAGTASGAPIVDYNNVTRPTPPSIGAFENVLPIFTVTGVVINPIVGQSFSGAVATISDNDPSPNITATIDWGDGSPTSAGTVTGSSGAYTVSGTHTYAAVGPYTVTVNAGDSSAQSSANSGSSMTGITARPGAPTGVSAASDGHSQTQLTWTASATPGVTYAIFRGTAPGHETTQIGTSSSASYLDTNPDYGITDYYLVQAVLSGVDSVSSNEASFTATLTAPSAPTLSAPTGSDNAQVVLSWTTPLGPVTGYNVYRGTTPGGEDFVNPINTGGLVSGTTFTDPNVTNGTTYYYVVKAANGAGASGASNEVSVTPNAPPDPPTLTATAGNGKVALSWAAARATLYKLYRSTHSDGSNATQLFAYNRAATYTDSGVTNGMTYFYSVVASNVGGSTSSALVSATPTVAMPTSLAAKSVNGAVVLTWKAPPVPVSGYNVYRGTMPGGEDFANPINTGGLVSGTTFTDPNVAIGTTYYYAVKAISGPEGPASNEASVTVLAPPSASTVTATPGKPGTHEISLSWTAASGAALYTLYRSVNSDGSAATKLYAYGHPATFTDSGLMAGTPYYYTVVTSGPGGTTPSAIVSAVAP